MCWYQWRSFNTIWQYTWWRHQIETFSALLAICAGDSPVPGEFPTQRPVTRSFDVYFDLRPNKRLSKQSWGWWFETQSRPLWRHRNDEQRPYLRIDRRTPRSRPTCKKTKETMNMNIAKLWYSCSNPYIPQITFFNIHRKPYRKQWGIKEYM